MKEMKEIKRIHKLIELLHGTYLKLSEYCCSCEQRDIYDRCQGQPCTARETVKELRKAVKSLNRSKDTKVVKLLKKEKINAKS